MRAPTALVLAAVLGGCSLGEEGPLNGLLITLDTTRADAVGIYGGPPGVTPNVDALAREGTTFAAARTVCPLTLPAHSSMLSGLYPPRHGVRTNGLFRLPDSAETLAELAEAAGFDTAAFVAAPVLDRVFGLDQGFATWDQPVRDLADPNEYGARPAEEVVAEAERWLRERSHDRPFLLWVHLFDAHRPWRAPPRFVQQARGNPYLAEVAHADAAVGELVALLDRLRLLERTAIVVAGDHGEGNGDHGERAHGHFLYESTLRVPLVVRVPGRRAGETDRGAASVADVLPTLADALGLAPPEGIDGRSLLAPIPEGRGVYFESYDGFLFYGWSPMAGWADERAKYIHSSSPELYLPQTWPDERVNRIHERSEEEVAAYRAHIAEVAARPVLRSGGTADAYVGVELARDLRALGYAEVASSQDLPGPLDDTGLPSPHTRADELERCEQALQLSAAGEHEQAVALLDEILSANPLDSQARELLADELVRLRRWNEALEVFAHLLATSVERPSIQAGLGQCLDALGRREEAVPHLRRAAELDPGDLRVLRMLSVALERLGRSEEAAVWRERLQRAQGF